MMSRHDPGDRATPSWSALPAVTTHTEIHAGPFTSLRDVLAFIERLSSVAGVRDVRLDRWVAGRAVLQVRHHDRMPLIASLRLLDEASLTISVRRPHGILIEVRPPV
jgi:hypothetical protein